MTHRTPPASAKRLGAPPDRGPTVAELQEELQYTQDVLKRYKTYVDEKLQRQLDQYAATCDELGVECARLRDENVLLHNRLESAQAAADKYSREARAEDDAKAAELQAMKQELDRLRHLETEHRAALDASRNAEDELAAVNNVLAKRDQEIHKLRLVLAERTSTAAPLSPETSRTAVGLGSSAGAAMCNSLQSIVSAGLEFSNTLAAACAHISIDCSASVVAWKGMQQKPIVPEALADALVELAAVERSQHAAIAQALKAFVLRQAELLDSMTAKEHEHHAEKELMKRRLDEIERDRKAEREATSLRAEKERLRSNLSGGPTGQRAAWGSSTVDELVLGAASQATRVNSVATQTLLTETAPSFSGDGATERLVAEVRRLQDESAVHKSTILLLEQQRRTFLGFVDNERVSSHVKAALSGSLTDAVRHAAGLSL